MDLDGDVDTLDKTLLQTSFQGLSGGRGLLSPFAGIRKGCAAYAIESAAPGLYDVRHRTLSQVLGTWTNRDPWEYWDDFSLLAYAHQQPLGRIDPSGRGAITVCEPEVSVTSTPSGPFCVSAQPMPKNSHNVPGVCFCGIPVLRCKFDGRVHYNLGVVDSTSGSCRDETEDEHDRMVAIWHSDTDGDGWGDENGGVNASFDPPSSGNLTGGSSSEGGIHYKDDVACDTSKELRVTFSATHGAWQLTVKIKMHCQKCDGQTVQWRDYRQPPQSDGAN